jgi:hypothetical protein
LSGRLNEGKEGLPRKETRDRGLVGLPDEHCARLKGMDMEKNAAKLK